MLLLKYQGYQIAIHVFHTRGLFLWIGSFVNSESDLKIKWFNDVPRGMKMFKLRAVHDSMNNEIKVTENIDKFLFDYRHSKFIECDSKLAYNITNQEAGKFKQKLEVNERIKPCMNDLAEIIEGMYKRYWLTSGTLLGWYRHCGIIPYTTDMDFSMAIKEYDDRLKEKFTSGKLDIHMWLQLGRKQNSLEFRLYGCRFTYDMFFLYELGPSRYCNYYHANNVYPLV